MRAAFKNKQRGAILTTHYMEEAEAVCDRVAIMVSGQLRFALPFLFLLDSSTCFSSYMRFYILMLLFQECLFKLCLKSKHSYAASFQNG